MLRLQKPTLLSKLQGLLLSYIMKTFLLQFKTYRVKSRTEPYNRINTRELNRVLVTKCLSYIHFATGLCYTNLAYPKGTCVLHVSRAKKVDLIFFFIFFLFHFPCNLFFYFSIFRTLGLGLEVIGHTVTSVTIDDVVTALIMRLEKRE